MGLQVPYTQSVEPTPLALPGAAPLGDNGLGEIARGTGEAAQAIRANVDEHQKRRDATIVMDQLSKFGDHERNYMADLKKNNVGVKAYDVSKTAESFWESEPAKWEADLENEQQKELWHDAILRQRNVSLDGMRAYEDSEVHKGQQDVLNATDVNAINAGSAGYDNPAAIVDARQKILDNQKVRDRFTGTPSDSETSKAQLLDTLTKLHSNVIQNMVEDSPERAQSYFDMFAAKGEIAGSVQDALRTRIKGSKDIIAAQHTADAAWNLGKSETDALDYVRKNSEGQQREHALSLVRQRYADQEAAKQKQQKDGVEAARNRFDTGGYAALTPGDIELMGRVSPGELKQMRSQTPQDRVPTNWNVYYGLLDQAAKDPRGFLDATERGVRQYSGDLNQTQLDNIAKVRADLANDVPSSILTVSQIVRNAARMPGEQIEKDQARMGALEDQVTAAVEDEQKRLNRKLSGDEIRNIANHYMLEVQVPQSHWFWFDTHPTKHLFETSPEQRQKAQIAYDAIPAADRAEAEADLKASGRPATPENVVALYSLFLQKGN